MTECVDAEDTAVIAEADDIATKITQFLIEGFKAKTGRDPDNNEIEQLFDELTPERYDQTRLGNLLALGIESNSMIFPHCSTGSQSCLVKNFPLILSMELVPLVRRRTQLVTTRGRKTMMTMRLRSSAAACGLF